MKTVTEIISFLDFRPMPNAFLVEISREIFKRVGANDPVEIAIMSIEDQLVSDEQKIAIAEIWQRVKFLPAGPLSSRARLMAAAIPSNDSLDGYGAEYVTMWAKDIGLPEEAIVILFDRVFTRFTSKL